MESIQCTVIVCNFIIGPTGVVKTRTAYWYDRRSRRLFLCFYSAIFQLTSAKFQTFAYNSRTVESSYMKFRQQFEINELYVCTKFRGNTSRDFGFRTRKPPASLAYKVVSVKNGLSTAKNISYGYMSQDTLSSQPIHFWPR